MFNVFKQSDSMWHELWKGWMHLHANLSGPKDMLYSLVSLCVCLLICFMEILWNFVYYLIIFNFLSLFWSSHHYTLYIHVLITFAVFVIRMKWQLNNGLFFFEKCNLISAMVCANKISWYRFFILYILKWKVIYIAKNIETMGCSYSKDVVL